MQKISLRPRMIPAGIAVTVLGYNYCFCALPTAFKKVPLKEPKIIHFTSGRQYKFTKNNRHGRKSYEHKKASNQ